MDKVERGLHRNFFPRKVSKTYNLQTCSYYDKAKSIDFEMRHLTKNLSMSDTSYEVVSILMWKLVNYFHVTLFCEKVFTILLKDIQGRYLKRSSL